MGILTYGPLRPRAHGRLLPWRWFSQPLPQVPAVRSSQYLRLPQSFQVRKEPVLLESLSGKVLILRSSLYVCGSGMKIRRRPVSQVRVRPVVSPDREAPRRLPRRASVRPARSASTRTALTIWEYPTRRPPGFPRRVRPPQSAAMSGSMYSASRPGHSGRTAGSSARAWPYIHPSVRNAARSISPAALPLRLRRPQRNPLHSRNSHSGVRFLRWRKALRNTVPSSSARQQTRSERDCQKMPPVYNIL